MPTSYRGQLDYSGDRYGLQLERLVVGRDFDPGIGFVRRPNMNKNFGYFRFSPRPRNSTRIRKLYWDGSIASISNATGQLEISVSAGRVNATPRLSVEPTYSLNRVRLPQGDFAATLSGSRVTYTLTPLVFASALLQYNSSTDVVSTNIRL